MNAANPPESAKPVHSPLGASSYYRWKACPGSIRQSAGLKSESSHYAQAGTRAHEVSEAILTHKPFDPLPEEDMEAVRVYTDFVESILKAHPNIEVWIEKRFDLSQYYPNLYGTADCVLYHEGLEKLVVIDYKHGAGIPVEVKENTQLLYYGLGAFLSLNQPVQSIELVIVQPRCNHADGPIRRWITTPARALDFAFDLIDDARATEDPQAPLNPGDWCRFCPAQAMNCPAVKQKALALAREEFRSDLSYDPQKLGEALRSLPIMENWIKAVREFGYREAEHGRIPPGFKMVAKRANRKWRQAFPPDHLAKEFGLRPPDCSETKTLSPAQLEKKIPKELKARLESMTVMESSGPTLVEVSDPRPSIAEGARDVFGIIES